MTRVASVAVHCRRHGLGVARRPTWVEDTWNSRPLVATRYRRADRSGTVSATMRHRLHGLFNLGAYPGVGGRSSGTCTYQPMSATAVFASSSSTAASIRVPRSHLAAAIEVGEHPVPKRPRMLDPLARQGGVIHQVPDLLRVFCSFAPVIPAGTICGQVGTTSCSQPIAPPVGHNGDPASDKAS